MKLSNTTKRLLKEDPELMGAVAKEVKRSISRLQHWIKDDNIALTSAGVLKLLAEKTGKSSEELMETATAE